MYGGNDRDFLYGGDGNETVYGGDGNDVLNGGNHNDLLYGDADNDLVRGDGGDDTMYGGAGLDEFISGAGNDRIWGDGDTDYFSFYNAAFGNDTISDFTNDVDDFWIERALTGNPALTVTQLLSTYTTVSGGNTIITIANGTIIFEGLTNKNLLLDDINLF